MSGEATAGAVREARAAVHQPAEALQPAAALAVRKMCDRQNVCVCV